MDHKNQVLREVESKIQTDPRNRMDPAQQLDAIHIQNFLMRSKKESNLMLG